MIPPFLRWPSNGQSTSSLFLNKFIVIQFLISSVISQKIVPSSGSSTFPACAVDCQLLIQAQDACVPPEAPQSTDAGYTTCYCQSAYLTALHSTGGGAVVCGTTCTNPSDQQLLVTWYAAFCAAGGKDIIGGPTTTSTTTAASATASAAAAAAATGSSSSGSGSWISTHYQWVIMVIILALAFSAIAAAGIYYKRRYDEKHQNLYHGDDRRHDQAMASGFFSHHSTTRERATPQPEMWGPQQGAAHPRDLEVAPVEEPAWVANSSFTGSTRSLVMTGTPRGVHSASRLSRGSTSRLPRDSPIPHAVTAEEPHEI